MVIEQHIDPVQLMAITVSTLVIALGSESRSNAIIQR